MSKENKEQAQHKAWAKIVAKAWSDEVFKQRLLKNPEAVFQENGIETRSGVTYKIHENTDKVMHITLPAHSAGNLSEDELKRIAGGLGDLGCAEGQTHGCYQGSAHRK